jgi:hypothetical protein
MARDPLLEHDCHYRLRSACCHACYGSVLTPSTALYRLIRRREHGAIDDGMDG